MARLTSDLEKLASCERKVKELEMENVALKKQLSNQNEAVKKEETCSGSEEIEMKQVGINNCK